MCGSHGGELRECIVQRTGGQAGGLFGGGDGVIGECSRGYCYVAVKDAGCSLLLFQPPESAGQARLLAAGCQFVWQRSSRKHTANRQCTRTGAAVAGYVRRVKEVGSEARADAALRLRAR